MLTAEQSVLGQPLLNDHMHHITLPTVSQARVRMITRHSSFSIILIEFDEFNEFKIWWCHWKKVTYI